MKPLLKAVVAICLLVSIHALPENIEDVKELPEKSAPALEAEESDPQARAERCTTCGSGNLAIKSPNQILAALQALPASEVHSQSSFEGCSSEKGCAGIKVKDGRVIERFGNIDAFKSAAAADTGNEFNFHAAGNFGNVLNGGIPKNGPFWWMNENSPFKAAAGAAGGAGGGSFEKFSKSSSSTFSSGGGGGAIDIGANPFLNGEFSKLASGFASSGGVANGGASQFAQQSISSSAKPASGYQSSFETSYSSSSKGGEVDISKNPFLNGGFKNQAGQAAFQGQAGFGASAPASAGFSASSANKFASSGYTGSSPSPFTASTAGSNVNLIQNSQKVNEFDFESQSQNQQNIDEIFQETGNVHAHEHSGVDYQTCAGQGYVCVHKARCNNGVVNDNGPGILQAKTKKQYCNTKTEICCRIEISTLQGAGGLQGSLGVGSATFSGSGSAQNGGGSLFATSGQAGASGFEASGSNRGNAFGSQGQGNQGGFGSTKTTTFESTSTYGNRGNFGASGQGVAGSGQSGINGQAGINGINGQAAVNGFTAQGSSTFGSSSQSGFNNQGTTGQGGFGANGVSNQGAFGTNNGGANRGITTVESSSSTFETRGNGGAFGGNNNGFNGNKFGAGTTGTGSASGTNVNRFGAGSVGSTGTTGSSGSSFNSVNKFGSAGTTGTTGSGFSGNGFAATGSGSFGTNNNKFGQGGFNNNEVTKTVTQTNFVETDSFSSGSEVNGFYRPGSGGAVLKPGVPYLPPDNTNSGSSVVSSTAFVTPPRPPTTPRPIYTTPRPAYIPPSTAAPGYLPPDGEQTINTETRVPKPYEEGNIILDENRFPNRPKKPVQPPQNIDIPAGCAAALKCTPIEFCTADGVISNSSVVLTRDQESYRVPLTDCKDIESGRVGKCCRDPTYSDPWPTNLIGKWVPGVFGGNDGQYTPDSRGSANNVRPAVTARPPVTGSVLLNNYRTPKPTLAPYGPNQVTPGSPVSQGTYTQKQFEVRGQGQYSQGGQGQYAQGGQGQYSKGSQGQYSQGGQGQVDKAGQGQLAQGGQGQYAVGGQGQYAVGGQGQYTQGGQGQYTQGGQGQYAQGGQATAGSQSQYSQSSFTQNQFGQKEQQPAQGQRGQGQLVTQGQGQIVTQGQGQYTQGGKGQYATVGQGQIEIQEQGGQGQFGAIQGQRGQGQLITQGEGQLISQGQGQGIHQGQGFSVSQGQGFAVEQAYSESINRVFLDRYSQSGGQCGLIQGQKPYGNRNELEVDFAEIPWQAMVLLQTNKSLLCGGVITRPDVVITTASCIEGLQAKNVLIKGGEWKLGIDDEPLPFQIVQVKHILRHPFYKSGSYQYDAAILVLTENLRLAKNIFPICLPQSAEETLDAFYNGAGECIVTGWGKQVLQAHLAGSILHSLNVSLINPGECQAKLSQDYPHLLEQYDQESCACGQPTNPINNICKVDTGSALACSTGDGHFVLRGVYSWDSGCQPGNQLAAFYKFDLEWYEWAIGLIESVRFAQFSSGSSATGGRFSGQINSAKGSQANAYAGVKGGVKGGYTASAVSNVNKGISTGTGQFGQGQFGQGQFGQGQFGQGQFGQGQFGGQIAQGQLGGQIAKGQLGGQVAQGQFGQFASSKFSSGSSNSGLNYQTQIKPIQNSYSASYSEKKVFQSEPKFITYTTKPEIVTFTTKPEIFTYTTKPKIVTFTTKPIITYETSGSGQNPQYASPGVTYNPSFSSLVGKHTHNAQCKCLEQ